MQLVEAYREVTRVISHFSWSMSGCSQTGSTQMIPNSNKLLFPPALTQKSISSFCFSKPLVTVLAAIISWSFPVERTHLAQTVRALTSAHVQRVYTFQARISRSGVATKGKCDHNKRGFPHGAVLKSCHLTRLSKPRCAVVFTLEISSFVLFPSPNKSLIVRNTRLCNANVGMWLILWMLTRQHAYRMISSELVCFWFAPLNCSALKHQ